MAERQTRRQRGAALLIFLILVVTAALTYVVSSLTPEAIEARRTQKSQEALALARDALIGYALKYRDEQIAQGQPDRMYGYLPLPDLGTTRNNNTGCTLEGCDAANFSGNALNTTVVGRLPWRILGINPLRDGANECLWYIVSGSHQRQQRVTPMNWDTLGQLDIVVANGTSALASALASTNDRPVAVIFAPGLPLPGQNRSADTASGNDVSQCGGNYNATNYLDPSSAIAGITNYLSGANSASAVTGDSDPANDPDTPKSLLTQGKIYSSGGNYFANACQGSNCALAVNDTGLALSSDLLFAAIRKNANFRNDINAMLDRMVSCLRDDLAAGTVFRPVAIPVPADGSLPIDPAVSPYQAAGRIYSHTCYDDTATAVNTVNPKGYFTNYRDQLFVAACPGANPSVNGVACGGALIFAGERGPSQFRASQQQRNTPSNYLEGDNLTSFANLQTVDYASCLIGGTFVGDALFKTVASGQVKGQDIVRCVPNTPSLTVVAPSVATLAGSSVQLASYSPASRTLTLGSEATHSNYGAAPANLFACAWTPETHVGGSGFRSYFRFRIRQVGEGFTFAAIDGDRNDANVCGAARQHLGYSGNNGITPYIQPPKLAVEFDTARNGGFSEPATLFNGRNDPCYQASCGASQNLSSNAHVAIVYWGYAAANAASPGVSQIQEDDNVHGFPWPSNFTWPQTYPWPPAAPTLPAASSLPPPHNPDVLMPYPTPAPDPPPGVAPLDRMGASSPLTTAPAKREFHARVEVTRSFATPADAKDGATGIQVKLWIEPHQAANISAMTYATGTPPTLSVTAAGHGFATGDTVVIKDAIPSGYNGEYPVTVIDADHFVATLPAGAADPGKYISFISWANDSFGVDPATVTSPGHGLVVGSAVTISGAIPTEYNGVHLVTAVIDANTYQFGLELNYEPGNMPPAIAAAKALSPQAIALANTTRPMSDLYPSFKPIISDSTTIYDEPMGACAPSAPLCPSGQSCGSDNMCYRPSFRNLRLGFTNGERVTSSTTTSRSQLIEIKDQATTWLE